jgi:hypothetical protein
MNAMIGTMIIPIIPPTIPANAAKRIATTTEIIIGTSPLKKVLFSVANFFAISSVEDIFNHFFCFQVSLSPFVGYYNYNLFYVICQ